MTTSPHNPFFVLIRGRFTLWHDASERLGVDRKTLQRWLLYPDRVRVADLMLIASVFDLSEVQLLAAAIASIAAHPTACEDLRDSHEIVVVDLFNDGGKKLTSSSN